jgi:hypothetical protein
MGFLRKPYGKLKMATLPTDLERPERRISAPLTAVRAIARRMGDSGGFVLTVATLCAAMSLAGIAKTVPTAIACAIVVSFVTAGGVARLLNRRGEAEVVRLSAPAAQTNEERRLRQRFGLRADSDARTVRADFAAKMKAWHSDQGTGGVDMDDVKTARNRLFHLVSARENAVPPSEIVAAWRAASGPLGSLWGALLPSDRLLAASIEGEAPLLGRSRHSFENG